MHFHHTRWGYDSPIFWLKEMTEQPITRTKAAKACVQKHYLWLSPLSSSAPRWRGSKATSIRWSRCWRLLPPVCCKFYLISPMIMATPSKAAINLTVSGRCAMQKGAITQSQMKRALIVTVALICLSGFGVAVLRTADNGGLHRLYGTRRVVDYRRYHLYRRHASLRLYWPWRYLGAGFLRLAERCRQLVSAGA